MIIDRRGLGSSDAAEHHIKTQANLSRTRLHPHRIQGDMRAHGDDGRGGVGVAQVVYTKAAHPTTHPIPCGYALGDPLVCFSGVEPCREYVVCLVQVAYHATNGVGLPTILHGRQDKWYKQSLDVNDADLLNIAGVDEGLPLDVDIAPGPEPLADELPVPAPIDDG